MVLTILLPSGGSGFPGGMLHGWNLGERVT